jgi:SAM-dependent methyltransferase
VGYFDDPKNVQAYVDMAEGYDGRGLIEVLKKHVPSGSTVLELGMGPGKDLDILRESYTATGSDNAQPFLDRYRERVPDSDLLLLDAVELDTERTFDAIYSNKVLIHLTRDELRRSLRRQARILNEGGVILHSLWYGEGEEEMQGLRFVYYSEGTFGDLVGDEFQVIEAARYTEMEENDSFYVVMKKRREPR